MRVAGRAGEDAIRTISSATTVLFFITESIEDYAIRAENAG
jgi:hypothetical protein